jgi:hypothetical protein
MAALSFAESITIHLMNTTASLHPSSSSSSSQSAHSAPAFLSMFYHSKEHEILLFKLSHVPPLSGARGTVMAPIFSGGVLKISVF